jgi:uncharacterized membrane protein (UPF0127 family)
MIFASKDGVVVAIMSDEQPMSDDFITPGVAVEAVIELNAGRAQAIGHSPGDRVQHRIFSTEIP